PLSAQAQIARTVARRAERRIISLGETLASDTPPAEIPPTTIHFINRLSDYLFVLARAINNISGDNREIFWQKSC
ncbi:MAG: ATP:cob(I)alamin adenosyltransferase, partial [Muribaculaceae bacterium]|nr:ATP:cob(I)alamin adenosyltransferase [Muribaculaceae bacterium]